MEQISMDSFRVLFINTVNRRYVNSFHRYKWLRMLMSYLSIFPEMIKICCNFIRTIHWYVSRFTWQILKIIKGVLGQTSKCKCSCSFVQYWQTLENLIKAKWSNIFIVSGDSMYCGLSKYFKATKNHLVQMNELSWYVLIEWICNIFLFFY